MMRRPSLPHNIFIISTLCMFEITTVLKSGATAASVAWPSTSPTPSLSSLCSQQNRLVLCSIELGKINDCRVGVGRGLCIRMCVCAQCFCLSRLMDQSCQIFTRELTFLQAQCWLVASPRPACVFAYPIWLIESNFRHIF